MHECSAFGLPNDKLGETVQAAEQLRDGAQAEAAGLIAFVLFLLRQTHTPKAIHFHARQPCLSVGEDLKSEVGQQAIDAQRGPR